MIPPVWAQPKKLLVVTTTMGFRHESIANLEAMLASLATRNGEFTLDFIHQPDGKPTPLKKDASAEEKAAYKTAESAWEPSLAKALEPLSPSNLKNYDGVVFASTTGDLPIPDKQGFLNWIKAGHAFIGLHSASDTFHHWPEYIEMLGGEFDHHGPQVSVDCLNQDPTNSATWSLPKIWTISQEEIYQFKNYDPSKVHELLVLDKHPNDKTPGHFPISWCKDYGAGRVFYTALGHRDDIISEDPNLKDRKNSVEISWAYQAHVLGGIEWALGLKSSVNMPSSTVNLSPLQSSTIASASPTNQSSAIQTTDVLSNATMSESGWRPLLDPKLSSWELWMGVPHSTVTALPLNTPTSPNVHNGIPLGLNNDPKHVFSVKIEEGEPVLCITGEIFGGLTTLESFSNYHFRTEFKWGENKWEPKLNVPRDNGILFDCTGPHGAFWCVWKRSFEFQVQEKDMGDAFFLAGTSASVTVTNVNDHPYYYPKGALLPFGKCTGSHGGRVQHLMGNFEKPSGEWNGLDLYVLGQTAVFVVNGHLVQILQHTAIADGPQHQQVPIEGGQIQIQCEGAEAYYRRMEIQRITAFPSDILKNMGQ